MTDFFNLKHQITTTGDGSKTIFLPDLQEHYHSIHGAVNESKHVFIKHGLELFRETSLDVLEIGFGTGLNALLTCLICPERQLKVNYTGIEKFPIAPQEVQDMNYCQSIDNTNCQSIYKALHECPWHTPYAVSGDFTLTKKQMLFQNIEDINAFDLIYYDAFGARVQPELWTADMFQRMYNALKPKGVLVTYSAKGSVRRAMLQVGFSVEKLPGPPGKREMLRAIKKT